MTEDSSPENLRKFLESDDPALVQMGLSMAKGSGEIEKTIEIVTELILEEKFSLETIDDIEDSLRIPIVRRIENKFNEEHDETWSRDDLFSYRLTFMEILSKYGDDKIADSVIYTLKWANEARDHLDETWEGDGGGGEIIVKLITCLSDIHYRLPSIELREKILSICKEMIGDSHYEVPDIAIDIISDFVTTKSEIENLVKNLDFPNVGWITWLELYNTNQLLQKLHWQPKNINEELFMTVTSDQDGCNLEALIPYGKKAVKPILDFLESMGEPDEWEYCLSGYARFDGFVTFGCKPYEGIPNAFRNLITHLSNNGEISEVEQTKYLAKLEELGYSLE